MKKTEKIEVRVSAEEKDRLSAMADARGQSVSDLIRDSLHSDVVSSRPYPKWPGITAILALGLAALALFFPFQTSVEADRTPSLLVRSTGGYIEIETALPLDVPHSDMLKFLSDGRKYKLAVDVSQPGNGTARAAFDLCETIESDCRPIAMEDLTLPIRPPRRSSYGVRAKSDAGETLFDLSVNVPEYGSSLKAADQ